MSLDNPRNKCIDTALGPVLFRFPDLIDFLDLFGDLPTLEEKPQAAPGSTYEGTSPAPLSPLARATSGAGDSRKRRSKDAREMLRKYDQLLAATALKPRISIEPCISSEQCIHVRDLDGMQRAEIAKELLGLGGFTSKEAERIAPLSATDAPSASSIRSVDDTDDSRARSSVNATPLLP